MSSVVSVIISIYNSSQFIIETLESIAAQIWTDVELIITDDCSTDNSVDICKEWIFRNGERFINSVVLESDVNTGVSANANRGLAVAKGEWIKFLGADDTLLPNCISDNMRFVSNNPEIRVLFSKVNIYQDEFKEKNLLQTTPGEIGQDSIVWPGRDAESQYRMLLMSDRIHFTPSVFLHRKTLLSIGGFDERFKLLEDYPLWLNLTKSGNKLYYMDKITVNYRRHSKAINNTGLKFLVNPNYFKQKLFRKIYTYPNLPLDVKLNQWHEWHASQLFRMDFFNRSTKYNRVLYSFLVIYLNPFRFFIWLRKKLQRKLKYNEFYV